MSSTTLPPPPFQRNYDRSTWVDRDEALRLGLERERRWVGWGPVFAGSVISVGTLLLLGLLGLAFGALLARGSPVGFSAFNLAWFAGTALVCCFLGGFSAARLGGAVRRVDGVIDGVLVWCLWLAASVWLVGSGVSTVASSAANLASPSMHDGGGDLPSTYAAVLAFAWGSFIIAALALLSAILGGTAGSLTMRHAVPPPAGPLPRSTEVPPHTHPPSAAPPMTPNPAE
jgi:hypothetical protein